MKKLSFICFSVNNWEKRMARKQQLMLHLSLNENVEKVFYIEPPLNFWRLLFLPVSELRTKSGRSRWSRAIKTKIIKTKESDNLYIFTPVFFIPFAHRIMWIYNLNLFISLTRINKKLERYNLDNTVLWVYHPFDYKLLDWFKKRSVAWYDWAEKWSLYFTELSKRKRKKIGLLEKEIIRKSDIVSTVSEKLMKEAKGINENSFHLFDGTVPEVFKGSDRPVPRDMENIERPIIGYIGTIMERIDSGLLHYLTENLDDVSIVLVGDVHDKRINIAKIKENRKIHVLGGKEYSKLGNYVENFDICILPYKADMPMGFPTKLLDYMASGKPVITTRVPGIEKLGGLVRVADTREEYLKYIREELNNSDDLKARERIEFSKKNSWNERANDIIKTIRVCLNE